MAKLPHKYDYELFVRTWQGATGAQEVADAMGMPVKVAYSLATRLRARGVPLQLFSPGQYEPIDIDKLKEVARGVH